MTCKKFFHEITARMVVFVSTMCVFFMNISYAQPVLRTHTINQSNGAISQIVANQNVQASSFVEIKKQNNMRIITANGIPNHSVGSFPNNSNPHEIRKQKYVFMIPLKPIKKNKPTWMGLKHIFAIAVNGIPFDPGAAEFYRGKRKGWQYEALSGAITLGLDENFAHVQPNGSYHYHGIPTYLLTYLQSLSKNDKNPILVGWAADGFPLYWDPNYTQSSYVLKDGKRPQKSSSPGGYFDGTFVQDYHFQKTHGVLDECNGMEKTFKEFPHGTYAYFLTENFPVTPRCYYGTPNQSFQKKKNHPSRKKPHPHRGKHKHR